MSTGHGEQYCEHGEQCCERGGLGEQVVDMVGKWWTVGWEARNGGWASSAAYWLASERVPCFARVQRPRQQFGDHERLAWSGLVWSSSQTQPPVLPSSPGAGAGLCLPLDHSPGLFEITFEMTMTTNKEKNPNRQTIPEQLRTEVWPLQSSYPLKGGHLHYYVTSQLKKTQNIRTMKTKQIKIKD